MRTAKKMQQGKFDLEDFLSTFKQIKKLGPLENLIKMIPGVPKELKGVKVDPKDMAHIEAIILSMTPYERRHPEVLKAGGIDPEEYTGFAFGVGLERIALLKYEIDDMRLLYENDVRFLKQF